MKRDDISFPMRDIKGLVYSGYNSMECFYVSINDADAEQDAKLLELFDIYDNGLHNLSQDHPGWSRFYDDFELCVYPADKRAVLEYKIYSEGLFCGCSDLCLDLETDDETYLFSMLYDEAIKCVKAANALVSPTGDNYEEVHM